MKSGRHSELYVNENWIRFRDISVNRQLHCASVAAKQIIALLACYAAYTGNYLLTFRDNLWVPSSMIKQSRLLIGTGLSQIFAEEKEEHEEKEEEEGRGGR